MNRTVLIIVIIFGVLLVFAGVGYMMLNGYLEDVTWEQVTIVIAAILGPIKLFFYNMRKDTMDKEIESIVQKNETVLPSNASFVNTSSDLDKKMEEKQHKMERLENDLQLLNANLEVLETKKAKLTGEISQER